MISMLNNVSGVAVNTNLEIDPVDYIELNKLHLAARIDLTDWQELESQEQRQDSKTSARYISMIRGKESHKLSEYFRKFIGSDESISSKQETSELFNAVSQFCEQKIENEEQKAQIKQKASEFCLEQADKGQNVVIRDFSNYAAEGVVDGVGLDPGQGLLLTAGGGDGERYGRARPAHDAIGKPGDEDDHRQIGKYHTEHDLQADGHSDPCYQQERDDR